MEFNAWIQQYSPYLFQTAIMAVGLAFTSAAVLADARARRIGNLIQLTQQHRDLWERLYIQPDLARILNPAADPLLLPVTAQEEMFVIFLILHLSSTYYATRAGFFNKLDGIQKDIEQFFSLPIPRAVWGKVKELQDPKFARFVEKALANAHPNVGQTSAGGAK